MCVTDWVCSIIHGRTGSGKSLLLAAITGEAKLISGKLVTLSQPNQNFEHGNIQADTWIIPHSMAFVAQIPWIENATIKNNILYGLPFVRDRFNAVIYASAMNKDLEQLTDAEDTEVGASGINLSGGTLYGAQNYARLTRNQGRSGVLHLREHCILVLVYLCSTTSLVRSMLTSVVTSLSMGSVVIWQLEERVFL